MPTLEIHFWIVSSDIFRKILARAFVVVVGHDGIEESVSSFALVGVSYNPTAEMQLSCSECQYLLSIVPR